MSSPYRHPNPPSPAAVATRRIDLGGTVAEFPANTMAWWSIVAALTFATVVAIASTRGVWVALQGAAIVSALGLVVVGIGTLQQARITLHEHGLRIRRRKRASLVPFSEIDGLYIWVPRVGSVLPIVRAYQGLCVSVVTHDGVRHDFDAREILNLPDLARRLERECSLPLVGPAGDALDRGEWLAFGPLCFNREMVRADSRAVAWSEIESVVFCPDQIEIRASGQVWHTAPLAAIPHDRVLRAVLPRLTRVELSPSRTALGR